MGPKRSGSAGTLGTWWGYLGLFGVMMMTGCATLQGVFGPSCSGIDHELRAILNQYVPDHNFYGCTTADDCIEGYVVSVEEPRAGSCPIYYNHRYEQGFSSFRSDPRVIDLLMGGAGKDCPVSEPVCRGVVSGGCIDGHCISRIVGCKAGQKCRFDPVTGKRF